MQQEARLTKGPVGGTLLRLTMPMIVAMGAMMGFNIVDTFFIGQLGTEQLAAMGFTIAVVMAVNSINMGIGVGTTAVVSRVIGQGNQDEARRLTMDAVLLGIVVSLVIVVLGMLTIEPLFVAMGAEGRVLEYVREYMVIWYAGLPLLVMPQIGNSGIRATGDTKTPAKIMITAMLFNAVLDPLYMFGIGPFPELGLQGAAYATVTTYGVALVLSAMVLRRRGLFSLERLPFSHTLSSWRRIVTIGVPAAITQLITPISTGIVTSIVATYGVAAVAGFGVASRLEMFVFMFVMSMGAALVPFVGQNWGAGKKERVSAAVRVAIVYAITWGLIAWLIMLAFGSQIAGLFNDNPLVVDVVTGYLAIVFPSLTLMGAMLVVMQTFNALHRPVRSMLLSVLRMFVLYVPLAYAGSALLGLTGVWWAAFAANLIAGVLAIGWFRVTFQKMHAEEVAPATTREVAPA